MPREEGAPSSEWLHGTVTLWAPDQVTQAHSEFILPVQSRIGHPPPSTAPDEPARRSRLTTAICELYELARVCHTAYSVHTGQALLGPRPSPRDPLSHARRPVGSQSLEGHQPLSGDRKPCCQIPHVQSRQRIVMSVPQTRSPTSRFPTLSIPSLVPTSCAPSSTKASRLAMLIVSTAVCCAWSMHRPDQ